MLQVKGFGVSNLRAIRESGVVDLRPINILVGKNSAGKSTFARVLPLLKQSSERRKQAPVLWFGRLVDFGSFSEVISSFAADETVDLTLRLVGPSVIFLNRRWDRQVEPANSLGSTIDICMKLGSESEDGRTVLRELTVKIVGRTVKIAIQSPRDIAVTLDDEIVLPPAGSRFILGQGAIIPLLRPLYLAQAPSVNVRDEVFFNRDHREQVGIVEMRLAISAFVHGNTLDERKDEIGERLPVAPMAEFLNVCQTLVSAPDTWHTNFAGINERSPRLLRLQRAAVIQKLPALLYEIDEAISAFCVGVSYLEPLRATAQRYYRREEVSTDELDPKGLNTTFFLQGLSARDRDSLNTWLNDAFGFTLTVKSFGGHSSLQIRTKLDGPSRNMADVGLGYSQIVPVAIQLWVASRKLGVRVPASLVRSEHFAPARRAASSIVVVEQPELHLHPAYQAKLADVFAACVKDNRAATTAQSRDRVGVQIVAETHSPNLINRLGELISEGRLIPDDVQVLVFEEDEAMIGATKIRIARFNESGVLTNWPVGFFDY